MGQVALAEGDSTSFELSDPSGKSHVFSVDSEYEAKFWLKILKAAGNDALNGPVGYERESLQEDLVAKSMQSLYFKLPKEFFEVTPIEDDENEDNSGGPGGGKRKAPKEAKTKSKWDRMRDEKAGIAGGGAPGAVHGYYPKKTTTAASESSSKSATSGGGPTFNKFSETAPKTTGNPFGKPQVQAPTPAAAAAHTKPKGGGNPFGKAGEKSNVPVAVSPANPFGKANAKSEPVAPANPFGKSKPVQAVPAAPANPFGKRTNSIPNASAPVNAGTPVNPFGKANAKSDPVVVPAPAPVSANPFSLKKSDAAVVVAAPKTAPASSEVNDDARNHDTSEISDVSDDEHDEPPPEQIEPEARSRRDSGRFIPL